MLEVLKKQKGVKSLIIITTDKVYQNYKFNKNFNENSELGGDDLYSSSKACCELLAKSYKNLFFKIKLQYSYSESRKLFWRWRLD